MANFSSSYGCPELPNEVYGSFNPPVVGGQIVFQRASSAHDGRHLGIDLHR
uniref:Bm317 n=1 Tax=Brugia malayi TaxID=6279 RepID=A0A1I9G0U6_BRUMA|nr:Bm317 [Brugia malayi]